MHGTYTYIYLSIRQISLSRLIYMYLFMYICMSIMNILSVGPRTLLSNLPYISIYAILTSVVFVSVSSVYICFYISIYSILTSTVFTSVSISLYTFYLLYLRLQCLYLHLVLISVSISLYTLYLLYLRLQCIYLYLVFISVSSVYICYICFYISIYTILTSTVFISVSTLSIRDQDLPPLPLEVITAPPHLLRASRGASGKEGIPERGR